MSDYPRPELPALRSKFRFDRLVAGIYVLLIGGNFVWWLFQMLRLYGATSVVRGYGGFAAFYAVITALMLWLLVLVGRSRIGGFIGVLLATSIVLTGAVYYASLSAVLYNFPLWTYCVARLFGLLGPKPKKA